MWRNYKHKLSKYIVSLFIVLCLLFDLAGGINSIQASSSDSTTWAISQYYNNPWLEVIDITPDSILLKGSHHPKSNQYYYRTNGFVLTSEPYVTSGAFPASAKNNRIDDTVGEDKVVSEDLVTTTYTLYMDDVIPAAAKVNITGESIGNGTKPIYLHVVYDIYKGDNCVVDDVIGVKEMINAPVKYNLGYTSWDAATLEKIPSFYNMRLDLTAASTYNIKVYPVDKNKVKLTTTPFDTKQAIYDQAYQYTLPATKKVYLVSGVNYEYTGTWYYTYTHRTNGAKASNNLTTTIEKDPCPDAMPGSTMEICLVYDVVSKPYKYNAIAVDAITGKKIGDVQATLKDTYYGSKVSITQPATIPHDEKTYTYQNLWDLKYENALNVTDNYGRTAGIVNNYIMPNAYPGSTATFIFKYSSDTPTGPPSTPTPTVPTPTPTTIPGPTPTPSPAGPTPTPILDPVIVPTPDSAYMPFTNFTNTGMIKADVRGAERFTAAAGVPTTESLYGQVSARDYLLGYTFEKKVGLEYYQVEVRKNYILKWKTATPTSAGGGIAVSETVPVKQVISVPRAYGYWEITNLECYKIDHAVLRNYALPGEAVAIYPNYLYYNPPTVYYNHSGTKDYHLIKPMEAINGIQLPDEVISADASTPTKKPTIKYEDFSYYALEQTDNIKVQSDALSFNGSVIMDSSVVETNAPDINESGISQCSTYIGDNVLYKNNQIIQDLKLNGTYTSLGTIAYSALACVNSSRPINPQFSIDGINNVVIHTPVVCNPSITANNDQYVQLLSPASSCTQLVLDPEDELSDFIVTISNNGFHTGIQGYFTRDFSYAIRDTSLSYIASSGGVLRNEVKFPFDVYLDMGKDYDIANDTYIKSGTWITVGRSSPRFYLPAWTNEGTYTVHFRTIAVNGVPFLTKTEEFANTSLRNYVATNTINVEVSGRVYGLTIYDISDYPMWEEVFRVKDSKDLKKNFTQYLRGFDRLTYSKDYSYTYTVGTNNQYGVDTGRNNKYTFPLVNGSHPLYKNQGILKTGYMFRFSLDTIGSMFSDACAISIKPNFYYVDKDGKNRKAVDLYYTEEISGKSRSLVKVGGLRDQTNMKLCMTGDLNLGIPQTELTYTAALRGMKYAELLGNKQPMFTFADIRLGFAFRTFIGQSYATDIRALSSYTAVVAAGKSTNDAMKSMQRWYGQYYIPNEVHVVSQGYDVMDFADKYGVDYSESFWLTEGYIIVNFTIETVDANGQRRLSYINSGNYSNKGNCNMWITENPILTKASNNGPTFKFFAGDIMLYYAAKRTGDDYDQGAIY